MSPLLSDAEGKLNMRLKDVQDKDLPFRNIGFQTEVGSVSHPDLESLERFLSREALSAYPDCGERMTIGGSVHKEWTYFKYLPFTEDDGVDHICQFAFPPHEYNTSNTSNRCMDSIKDYTWAAQLVQFFQYKSLVEDYSNRMWEWYVRLLLFYVIDISMACHWYSHLVHATIIRYLAFFLWKTSSPGPTFRGALYDSR
jgi:hypothetical protein